MTDLENTPFNLSQVMESIGHLGFAQDLPNSLDGKSCCAILYQLEPVRLLLGDTFHPGGLALTHQIGKLVDIKPDDLVLTWPVAVGPALLL